MTVREDLAAAANTALGAGRCSAFYRSSTRPGDAWVSWARADRDDTGFGYLDHWEVRVALAQDLATAEKWVEDNLDALTEALAEHLVVTAAVFVTLVTDTGNTPGVVVEGVREH